MISYVSSLGINGDARGGRKAGIRMNRFAGLCFLALAASVTLSVWAQTKTYTVTDLGPGYPYAINNSGQVVGFNHSAAFLYSGGIVIDLGALLGSEIEYSEATGINSSGQVVGWFSTDSGENHSFLYSDGSIADLNPLLGAKGSYPSGSFASGINDSGQIVGSVQSLAGGEYAFLYGNGRQVNLGAFPAPFGDCPMSGAAGVNNHGEVVGWSVEPLVEGWNFLCYGGGVLDATRFSGVGVVDLGASPLAFGAGSEALAINDGGQIVGCWLPNGDECGDLFVYSGGSVTRLLGVSCDSLGTAAINNRGEVVGGCSASSPYGPFLYSGGKTTDLNSLVTLPAGFWLRSGNAINDLGQIAAWGCNAYTCHSYLLTPGGSPLKVVNPFASYAASGRAPPTLDVPTVLNSSPVTSPSLAADGESALVLEYQFQSPQPVTFTLTGPGEKGIGSLGEFDPEYLANPHPVVGEVQTYKTLPEPGGPDAAGNYTFLALLWAPDAMPQPGVALANLEVTATQEGQTTSSQASIALEPPPLLLVHGIWSKPEKSGFLPGQKALYDAIAGKYPHNHILGVNYGPWSDKAFNDPNIQGALLDGMSEELASAAANGMAARTVDVVAHSMGGLATRYFMSTNGNRKNPALLPNPVHKLITIDTPHEGSALATALEMNLNNTYKGGVLDFLICFWRGLKPCTLQTVFASNGNTVSTGVESLEPTSDLITKDLDPANKFSAIVGLAPTNPVSTTENLLDQIIGGFVPGKTVATLLGGQPSDTIVPEKSQAPGSEGQTDMATISGVVHTNLCEGLPTVVSAFCKDKGVLWNAATWAQTYYWLTGGTGPVSAVEEAKFHPARMNSEATAETAALPPVLDLTGYTQVASSNATFTPATGSALTISAAASITAHSPTKTISEVLLLQTITDPTDTLLLGATQAPFSVPFTPTRLGSTTFGAVTVFTDKTYAVTTLNYAFQPSGTPYALNLVNAPAASMSVGASRVVDANAQFASGPVDVTQAATYTAASGSTRVFSVSSGGFVTAKGDGLDTLNVSYGGVTATAPVSVGACTFALYPANQIVSNSGGEAVIKVATQPGCAWTAGGGAAWFPFAEASGSGDGEIVLKAAANTSGGTQAAFVTLGGQSVIVTQPATACGYVLSQTQVFAPAAGMNGTITATSSCPVIAASNESWLTAMPVGSVVQFTVAPNNGPSARRAELKVGTVPVAVIQSGYIPPTPHLEIGLGHAGNFEQGQNGAKYEVKVTDKTGAGPTSGTVTVTETLPVGLTLVSMAGTAWNCSANRCTRGDALYAGISYPPITVTVDVAKDAPASVTDKVTVSGGHSVAVIASDPTTIKGAAAADSNGIPAH